jgi:hypothetical protein
VLPLGFCGQIKDVSLLQPNALREPLCKRECVFKAHVNGLLDSQKNDLSKGAEKRPHEPPKNDRGARENLTRGAAEI